MGSKTCESARRVKENNTYIWRSGPVIPSIFGATSRSGCSPMRHSYVPEACLQHRIKRAQSFELITPVKYSLYLIWGDHLTLRGFPSPCCCLYLQDRVRFVAYPVKSPDISKPRNVFSVVYCYPDIFGILGGGNDGVFKKDTFLTYVIQSAYIRLKIISVWYGRLNRFCSAALLYSAPSIQVYSIFIKSRSVTAMCTLLCSKALNTRYTLPISKPFQETVMFVRFFLLKTVDERFSHFIQTLIFCVYVVPAAFLLNGRNTRWTILSISKKMSSKTTWAGLSGPIGIYME